MLQFPHVMGRLSPRITVKASRQTAISATIGVHHQDHPFRSVKPHGLADLFQHEFAIALALWRSHDLCSAGNLDGIGVDHSNTLEELAKAQFKTIIEAP